MNDVDPRLDTHLAAWREDSRVPAAAASVGRARSAMLAAVVAATPSSSRSPWPFLRGRFGAHPRRLFAASCLSLAAATVVAALGWNAPVGSPLHGVRSARQSVQLAVPGVDLAALHLQFAEQSLADGIHGSAAAASLADAGAELAAAESDLPADHRSPLWARWTQDETRLASETAAAEEGGAGSPTTPGPSAATTERPEGSPSPGAAPPTSEGSGAAGEPRAASPGGTAGGSASPRPSAPGDGG